MRIASLLIRCHPQHLPDVRQALGAIPGIEIHLQDHEHGTLVITAEDGPHHAVSESITAASLIRHVLSATLIYEHSDELPEPTGA